MARPRKSTKPEKTPRIVRQLLSVINDSKQTHYSISKATGIDQATLSKFCSGSRGMQIGTFCRLCEHFGLELAFSS